MVKKVEMFECDKCGHLYDNVTKAEECEMLRVDDFAFKIGPLKGTKATIVDMYRKPSFEDKKHVNCYVVKLVNGDGHEMKILWSEDVVEQQLSLVGLDRTFGRNLAYIG
jgi:hypothetical protein